MKQRVSRNAKVISISMILSSAIIAGGIAYASGDAFTACVNKNTGLTRIISGKMKCYKSERQVTWNQSGPTGAQGATGATGSTGLSGVSEIYSKSANSANILTGNTGTVLSAQIPAGNYNFQFQSQISYFNNNVATAKTRYATCLLTTHSDVATSFNSSNASKVVWPVVGSNTVFRTSFAPSGASIDEVGTHPYHVSGTLNFTTSSTVYFNCGIETLSGDTASTGQAIVFYFPRLTLIKADTLSNLS